MSELPGPMEYWDMKDGDTRVIRVDRYEKGMNEIQPRTGARRELKRVDHLRLHLQPGSKETLPYYWDITSKTLMAGLEAYLTRPNLKNLEFTITKRGEGLRTRFSLAIRVIGAP